MKTIRFIKSLGFVAAIAAIATSCVKKDFDEPDMSSFCARKATFVANTTIKNVKEKYEIYSAIDGSTSIKMITDKSVLKGVVIANDVSGNLYKSIYIRDVDTGEGIEVSIDENSLYTVFPVGQIIYINLEGKYLDKFGAVKLGGSTYEKDGNLRLGGIPSALIKTEFDYESCAKADQATPVEKKITELTDDDFGKLIKITGVQFVQGDIDDATPKFYNSSKDQGNATNRTIEDSEGNSLTVRNSKFAKFAATDLPKGSGSIIGVYSAYGTSKQFLIRTIKDVDMTAPRLKSTPAVIDPVLTLNDDFSSHTKGDDIKKNGWRSIKEKGDRAWYCDEYNSDKYAKMSVYKSTDAENVGWLITPPLKVGEAAKKVFSFDSKNGFNTGAELKVLISSDYDGSATPQNATWTELNPTLAPVTASNYSAWTPSGDVDLSAYSGNVYIAFRYTGSEPSKAATWNIDNVKFNSDGSTPGPGPGVGSGTQADPYTVADAIANNSGSDKWVTGYMVGSIDGKTVADASFTTPFTGATNVIIAPTAGETDITKCLIVQLPPGKVRTDLNLKDNASNHKKTVKIRGSLEAYFGKPGLKSTDAYEFEGTTYIPTTATGFFVEKFATDKGTFAVHSITDDAHAWKWAKYGSETYMSMSGFDKPSNTTVDNNDWLVSSAIDLTGKSNVKFFIKYKAKLFGADFATCYKVKISTDYDGTSKPTENGTWEELTGMTSVDNWDAGEHTFTLDSKYNGKTVYVAFQYISASNKGGTWQIIETSMSE